MPLRRRTRCARDADAAARLHGRLSGGRKRPAGAAGGPGGAAGGAGGAARRGRRCSGAAVGAQRHARSIPAAAGPHLELRPVRRRPREVLPGLRTPSSTPGRSTRDAGASVAAAVTAGTTPGPSCRRTDSSNARRPGASSGVRRLPCERPQLARRRRSRAAGRGAVTVSAGPDQRSSPRTARRRSPDDGKFAGGMLTFTTAPFSATVTHLPPPLPADAGACTPPNTDVAPDAPATSPSTPGRAEGPDGGGDRDRRGAHHRRTGDVVVDGRRERPSHRWTNGQPTPTSPSWSPARRLTWRETS